MILKLTVMDGEEILQFSSARLPRNFKSKDPIRMRDFLKEIVRMIEEAAEHGVPKKEEL